ncbi:ATP-binding protein [Rhodocaloribacter sp.]
MLPFDDVLRALRSINAKILTEPDRMRILEHIAASAMVVFGADSCRIHRFDPVTRLFQREVSVGLGAEWMHLPRRDGMGARVMQTGSYVWENDPAKLNPVVRKAGITSTGAFPLHPDGARPVGVLYLHFRQRPHYSEAEANLVYHFAYHAGLAIQLAELRESDKRHIYDLEALREAVMKVAEAGTLHGALSRVADLAMRVLRADAAILYPWDETERTLKRELVVGAGLDMEVFRIAPPRPHGLTHTLMRSGSIVIEDAEELPEGSVEAELVHNLRRHIMEPNELRAFIGIALRSEKKSVGVLYAFFRTPHTPTAEEMNTIRIFAEMAATRIQLAKLSEAQRKAATAEAIATLSAAAAQFAHKMANVAGTVPMIINDISEKLHALGIEDDRIFTRMEHLKEDTQGLMEMANQLRLRDIGNPEPVDLGRVVAKAIKLAHLRSINPNITVTAEITPGADRGRAVEVHLVEIVVNLLQNAAQAGARTIRITTELRAEDEMLDLHVIDDGSGIAPEDAEKIFMPLYSTKEKGEAKPHGIGLWASRYQIERMGGEITMESVPGAGARFTVSLALP